MNRKQWLRDEQMYYGKQQCIFESDAVEINRNHHKKQVFFLQRCNNLIRFPHIDYGSACILGL
jgi:hypothetical protein